MGSCTTRKKKGCCKGTANGAPQSSAGAGATLIQKVLRYRAHVQKANGTVGGAGETAQCLSTVELNSTGSVAESYENGGASGN